MTVETDEIFYFYPGKNGYQFSEVNEVHVIGEFNNWGMDFDKLNDYKLIKDRNNKWVGLLKVPRGRHFYKFLVNKHRYVPELGHFAYSTSSTPEWAKKAIWYQIMVDRFYCADKSRQIPNHIPWNSPPDYFNNFGGDLKGIKEKLGYLRKLFGTLENTALYLNPLHLSLASNHKYWPEDFDKIDPQFGTEEDLVDLIEAIHNEGGKIILDLVYNHTGLNHYAFMDVLKYGEASQYAEWYRGLPFPDKIELPLLEAYVGDKPQNITIENGPADKTFNSDKESFISVWDGKYRFPVSNCSDFASMSVIDIINSQPFYKLVPINSKPNYRCWFGFFEIPELNTANTAVTKHLFDVSRKWIRLGIDGFRLDVPQNLNNSHDFWKEFRKELREEAVLNGRNPDDIYIVGEIWHNDEITNSYLYADENSKPVRFDAIMNYPIRENFLNFLSGEILAHSHEYTIREGEISVSELDLHLHKNMGHISWGTDMAQYNVFSSHDTRRLRSVIKDDKKLKAVIIAQFTLPGAPTIYYGDEIGMNGLADPACRATVNWDFVENLANYNDEFSIFSIYQKLISLRKRAYCLIEGLFITLLCDDYNKIYVFARYNEGNAVITIVTRHGLNKELVIDLSNMPFENIKSWHDPINNAKYEANDKKLIINPLSMNNSFGFVLCSKYE